MEYRIVAIVAAVTLAIVLVIAEIRRRDKARLAARLIATVLALGCFLLMLLPIKYTVSEPVSDGEINLLTEGIHPDSLNEITKSNSYLLDSTLYQPSKVKGATWIPDLVYFLKSRTDIQKVNIYGYGLGEEQLTAFKDHQLSFHPGSRPEGIIQCNWQSELRSTESLRVQGQYYNSTQKPVKLMLFGLGAKLDSVTVKANTTSDFDLASQSKQLGKAVYTLLATQGKDTIAQEPIPFVTVNSAKVRVLILASSPDFEYKFLKNWLYENQYAVALRSQISKDKYSTDLLNMEQTNMNKISGRLLKKFDLVIVDEDEWIALTPSEKSTISQEVSTGLGLLIRLSANKSLGGLLAGVNSYAISGNPAKQIVPIVSATNEKLKPLTIEQSLFLKASSGSQPLVLDAHGKVLVDHRIYGRGRITASALLETYQWQLASQQADFAAFWSAIINKTSRRSVSQQVVQVSPAKPTLHRKVEVIVEQATAATVIPNLSVNGRKLSPRQNIALPFRWDAPFWPTKNGWNELSVEQSKYPIFVYDKLAWRSVANHQKRIQTQLFVNSGKSGFAATRITTSLEKQVSVWWFFIGFLLSISFLWFESHVLRSKN